MKKLLLDLVSFVTVFAFALLIASCGGGGGGGSDYSEPAAPVQNENSLLSMNAPTYSDVNLNITNSPSGSTFASGTSVTFTAAANYEGYYWLVNGVSRQTGAENSFTLDTTSLSGPCQLVLYVTDSDGNYYGDTKDFTVRAAN
ncbi:MAG: hypothetical protein IJJ66_07180 [Treponema sp.]|nr:hypothetical protein [Treponema sp.]